MTLCKQAVATEELLTPYFVVVVLHSSRVIWVSVWTEWLSSVNPDVMTLPILEPKHDRPEGRPVVAYCLCFRVQLPVIH